MRKADAGWREVALADLACVDRGYCRLPVGMAWSFDRERFGLLIDDVPNLPAHATSEVVRAVLTCMPSSFDLLVDARRLVVGHGSARPCVVQCAVDSALRALRPHVRRYVLVVGDDCSTPWWHGVHQIAGLPLSWRVVTDVREAARWLELEREVTDELAALGHEHGVRVRLVRTVDALLTDLGPHSELAAIARRLAMSVRSLQRALARDGVTFHGLRTRRQVRLAEELLGRGERVEEVATRVGFQSTSHFANWFRRHRGMTPSAFRRHTASSVHAAGHSRAATSDERDA